MRCLACSVLAALFVALFVACGDSGHRQRSAGSPTSATSPTAPASSPTPTGRTTSTAPPAAGPAIAGFVAFGDFGGGPGQAGVAAQMRHWASGHRVDALVTTGDNVYPTGEPQLYASELDAPYQELRATRPLWATLGNHDVGAGHGAAELAHLGLPPVPYEKDLPGVQLLFLDANHPDAAQASWLDSALSRPGPPFRVVVFHQPAWSCGLHGSTSAVDGFWVPVIEAHKVALVLNGHDHDYERFTSPGGVTYVVTGGGGQTLYPLVPCSGTPPEDAKAQTYHFTGVEVAAHTLTMTAVATDGAVIDQAVLTR